MQAGLAHTQTRVRTMAEGVTGARVFDLFRRDAARRARFAPCRGTSHGTIQGTCGHNARRLSPRRGANAPRHSYRTGHTSQLLYGCASQLPYGARVTTMVQGARHRYRTGRASLWGARHSYRTGRASLGGARHMRRTYRASVTPTGRASHLPGARHTHGARVAPSAPAGARHNYSRKA